MQNVSFYGTVHRPGPLDEFLEDASNSEYILALRVREI